MGRLENGVDSNRLVSSNSSAVRICILLLLASAINYMDRQTLGSIAPRIRNEFNLTNEQFGNINALFGWGFAIGSLFFGFLVDYIPVRWLYPIGLLAWSAVGFLTAYVRGYEDLLVVRALLGFFEAVHWPCGLKTTQTLLSEKSRGLGNSVLQSGTSIGACITPLIMLWLLTPEAGSWRWGFQVIGLIGLLWIVAWFLFVSASDLLSHSKANLRKPLGSESRPWWREMLTVKLLVVLVMLMCINTTWQILRDWLSMILQDGFKMNERQTLAYMSVWYLFSDIGCIASGAIALTMVRRGWSVKGSRMLSCFISCACCALLAVVPNLPTGFVLLFVMMLAGAGALGLFPMYYSFTQDISRGHQGKVTGITSIIGWGFSGFAQPIFGGLVDRTKSYQMGLIVIGLLPVFSLIVLALLWPGDVHHDTQDRAA